MIKKQLQVANGMYDFFENEDVFWENKTHATDLFGQRTIELIKQKVRLRWYNSSGNVLAKVSLRQWNFLNIRRQGGSTCHTEKLLGVGGRKKINSVIKVPFFNFSEGHPLSLI